MNFRVGRPASQRIDEIYQRTLERWGDAQADDYILGLFARFEEIADRTIPRRAIPSEYGVDGYYCRYQRHFIYWRVLEDGSVGIVTVLHERMHQIDRFREADF